MDSDITIFYGHKWAGDIHISLDEWMQFGPGTTLLIQPMGRKDGKEIPISFIPTLYRNNAVSRFLIGIGLFEDPWKHRNERYEIFSHTTSNENDLMYTKIEMNADNFQSSAQFLANYQSFVVITSPANWVADIFALSPAEKYVLTSNNHALIAAEVVAQSLNEMRSSDILACVVADSSSFPLDSSFIRLQLSDDFAEPVAVEKGYLHDKYVYFASYVLKTADFAFTLTMIEMPSQSTTATPVRHDGGYMGLILALTGRENLQNCKDAVFAMAESMHLETV